MTTASTTPLISVVMPAYNAERYVGAAISGILAQTYPEVELIVVDDGSTDRTPEIVRAYGSLLRYIRQENAGSAAARNVGMAAASGEFIALCDSDDIFAPLYLERMLAAYREAGGGRRFVMSNGQIYTDVGTSHGRQTIGSRYYPYEKQRLAMLQQNFVPYTTLFPTQMARELDGFAAEVKMNEDWDFFLRAVFAGWLVEYQREPLVDYRWTPGAKTTNTERARLAAEQILGRARELLNLTEEEAAYLDRIEGGATPRRMDEDAASALRAGDVAKARALWSDVADLTPVDRRQHLRAKILASVPGAATLWRVRLNLIDRAMGRRSGEKR